MKVKFNFEEKCFQCNKESILKINDAFACKGCSFQFTLSSATKSLKELVTKYINDYENLLIFKDIKLADIVYFKENYKEK